MSPTSLVIWREYLRLASDTDISRWLTLITDPGGFMELRLVIVGRARSVNSIFGPDSHLWLTHEIDDCQDECCLRGLMLVALECEQHRRAREAIKETEWYQSPTERHDVRTIVTSSVGV